MATLLADKLFSDGKLVPLQLSSVKPQVNDATIFEIRSPKSPKTRRRPEISSTGLYLFSPKAPRCSSCWKDLGLKKLYHNSNPKPDPDQWGGLLVWCLIGGRGGKRAHCINQLEAKIANFLGGEGAVTNVKHRLHQLMLSIRTVSLPTTPSNSESDEEAGMKTMVKIESCDEKGYSIVNINCKDRPRLMFEKQWWRDPDTRTLIPFP
ncbi:uncharacterized protein LOC115992730 [Quercus lobata]|uniref:uncharacterized protein LOC115992730 n=1 Tax=Quercus lobata TaxID=97700 RepID=UPI0012462D06|nr:uncharacterized protein LOC115992730 [Quercus lobata]